MNKSKIFLAAAMLAVGVFADPVYTGPVTAQEVRVRAGVGHFMEKVKAGKEVRVAYLGGSITAMNGWRNLTTEWFRATYPQAKFKEIHASIGGTGSNLGAFRVAYDALRHNPDLLFVEFATNDSKAEPEAIWRSMEGIVRQTWKKDPATDIVFAYTITEAMKQDYLAGKCNRAASAMEQLADHYGIPSICFGPRVIDAVKAGTLVMSGKDFRAGTGKTLFAKDGTHPAPAGHRFYLASVVNGFTQMKDIPPTDHAAALRTPFVADNLEAAKMVDIKPSMLVGDWKKLPPSDGKVRAFSNRMGEMWYSGSPGATLRFTFRGTCCQIYDLLGPDGGQVWITVDGKKSAAPVARFDSYCTYHRIATLGVFNGADGVHTVEITVDKDQPSRQPVAFRLKNPAVELAKPKYQGTKFWPAKIMLVGDLVTNDVQLRYRPVSGGYRTNNGDGEFNRPLYGWHGDDRVLSPCKSLPWTSDRPKVALKVFRGYRIDNKVRGVLQFGDGTEDVEYRYVWGRAEYDLKGKGTVKMVRSAQSDGLLVETTGDLPPKFDGAWDLAAKGTRGGATYYDFERKGMRRPATIDPAAAFDAATNHFERIARTIEIKTPDPVLDSLLPCQLLVADAMFEGRHITHGATNWKQAFAGWRVAYICYATGWEERFKENAREHFRSQRADGRIPNEPKRDSFYNMCEEFVVSVMRYWKWTHDDDFMREIAYDGVKRHLEWMDRNMKVPGTELYENWLNTWNTDDKWTNGGAGTISSAYYAFDCRVMSEVAQRLGKVEDAAYFAARSKAVEDAIAKSLWHEGDGVWGEYRERFGLKRLMRAPDLSTVYIAIDNLVPDLARNRRAVFWVEDNVPTFFARDGATLLYSSNRLPFFWTSCGRYPNETIFWALACYQAGEPELGWRNLHDAAAVSARGAGCGPGVGTCDLNFDFACYANIDFADNTAGYLRAVTEGVFGIVEGREIRPSFPASWDAAEIKSPYISYRWTRTGGVEVTGGSRAATVKVVPVPKPQFAGAAIPPRHTRWGHPKGEGSDLTVPQGAKAEFVDLSKSFNQNLRLLHKGKYSPRIANKPWSRIPRTLMANGRTWWEHHETAGNRRWPKDYAVPKTLERWPADGALATEYGSSFRLGPKDGINAVFTSFYEQFPDVVEIPLSGKARKLALLSAVVTNPNVAWMEAACVKVQYADGTEESLSLVPPDNCDDWLNYSQGQWSYYDAKRDTKPYAVKGFPVMLGETAHANAHAIVLDPAKELKSLRVECRGTETFVGLLAATLYR